MNEAMPIELVRRLTAASRSVGVIEGLHDLTDDVAGWDADGLSDREIDERITQWAVPCAPWIAGARIEQRS